MRPVVDSVRRKLRGLSKRYPGGVLKSAMQRLEQGDVVTETQSAPEWPAVGEMFIPRATKPCSQTGACSSKNSTGQARRRVF